LRILHLISSHRWTGAAEPATALAMEQVAMGHEVEIACVRGGSFWKQLKRLGAPRMEGLDLRPGFHPIAAAGDVFALRKILSEKNFDVVHSHLQHDHWTAASALAPGGLTKKPLLVRTFHRDAPPRRDPAHKWLYASASDLLITVSRSGREMICKRYSLPEERVAWVRGAVDIEYFHPGLDRMTNRTKWKIAADVPIAGIVARMQPHRGHLMFIETIEAVVKQIPNARYIIAGRGELKYPIRELVRKHALRDHLIRVGYRKHDLRETYACFDVSVLLAQGSDGTCRAILEAMACGKPVIGVNVGAIADTIEPGKTGWLVEPNDRAGLERALIEALSNPTRTAEMGRAAREAMEKNFTQRARAEATIKAYESRLTARKP